MFVDPFLSFKDAHVKRLCVSVCVGGGGGQTCFNWVQTTLCKQRLFNLPPPIVNWMVPLEKRVCE